MIPQMAIFCKPHHPFGFTHSVDSYKREIPSGITLILKSVLLAGIAFIAMHANAECILEKEAVTSNLPISKLSLESAKQGKTQPDKVYGDISNQTLDLI